MPSAVGVHNHPFKKLGKRPARAYRPKVPMGLFLNLGVQLPPYPVADPMALTLQYPMDHNDVAGDCVVAGGDHTLQTIHAVLGEPYTNWSDDQQLHYYQTQNSGFKSWADAGGPNDGGMYVDQFLSYLVSQGVLLGYGSVNPTNDAELDAALYLGIALITGETLQVAQQQGSVWDYVAGSPAWGGHCTVGTAYDVQQRRKTVSWGTDQYEMTDAFVRHQVDEAYMVLTDAQVAQPGFRDNFDLAGYGAAFTALTGKPFPAAPPTPTVIDLKATSQQFTELETWVNDHRHYGINKQPAADVAAILKTASS